MDNHIPPSRKIIHIDMDCFYAAIEIRDQPHLAHQPVAVGGMSDERSVLCTCNYIARKYGVRSAMSSGLAKKLCPNLIILPVDMKKYRKVANQVHAIFHEFTQLVEPLSLDEAYLDVSQSELLAGSATWIAQAIRKKIYDETKLTASAGVAPNKFLAKIASGWRKPNGLFVIHPSAVEKFIQDLPVKELHGVGQVSLKKLNRLGLQTCADLQAQSMQTLITHFGKFGEQLYYQARGIDQRPVEPNRERKSLSVENTFREDLILSDDTFQIVAELFIELKKRIENDAPNRKIKSQYIKLKFSNFQLTTIERKMNYLSEDHFIFLLKKFIAQHEGKRFRLLGLGVSFVSQEQDFLIQTEFDFS